MRLIVESKFHSYLSRQPSIPFGEVRERIQENCSRGLQHSNADLKGCCPGLQFAILSTQLVVFFAGAEGGGEVHIEAPRDGAHALFAG